MRKAVMRKIALVPIGLILATAANAQTTCKGLTQSYDFTNGFDGWVFGQHDSLSSGNGGLASYQSPTQNNTETSGHNGATLSVLPEAAPDGSAWQAGLISTKKYQTYGVFQATVNIDPSMLQPGMSWSFWLLGNQMLPGSAQGWPIEFDAAEQYGPTFDSAVHSGFMTPQDSNSAANNVYGFSPGEHTFTIDWEPDKITFYIDNKQTRQVNTPADAHVPMMMILGTGATKASGWTSAAAPGSSGSINVLRVRAFDSMQDAQACDSATVTFTPTPSGPSVQQGQDAVQTATNLSVDDVAKLAMQGMTADGQSTSATIAAAATPSSMQAVAALASADTTPAQPTVLAFNAPSGTMPPPPASPTSISIDASGTNQTITEPSGNGSGTVSGTGNSVLAIGGTQRLHITGIGNTVITGPYDDSVTVEATGNTIDLGGGANTITLAYKPKTVTDLMAVSAQQIDQDAAQIAPLTPTGNIFVSPQPGMGVVTIQGTPMDSKDVVDLTQSLAGVAGWNHQMSDIPKFVTVRSGMTGTEISVQGRPVVVLASGVTKGNPLQYLVAR